MCRLEFGNDDRVSDSFMKNVRNKCHIILVMSANTEMLKRAQKWHENVSGRIGNQLMHLSQKTNVNSLEKLSRSSIRIRYPSIPEME